MIGKRIIWRNPASVDPFMEVRGRGRLKDPDPNFLEPLLQSMPSFLKVSGLCLGEVIPDLAPGSAWWEDDGKG